MAANGKNGTDQVIIKAFKKTRAKLPDAEAADEEELQASDPEYTPNHDPPIPAGEVVEVSSAVADAARYDKMQSLGRAYQAGALDDMQMRDAWLSAGLDGESLDMMLAIHKEG